ncbi:MAG: DUF5121 domain-containing protein [Dysgonamonadaceae bacterium]|jgi:hypothetical protein|nr:DUF5121 domain-containing protein [Dysgonamonadaceae bacterium]
MKKNSFIYLIAVFFAFLAGVAVSSCEDSKDDATSEGLSIKVFSPTKIIEGQEVMITGTGLDEVTSVVFPGGVNVTTIKMITPNDIRVIAPAGISPEGGELTVQAGNRSVTARIPITVGSPSVATLAPGDQAGIGSELIITGADMEFFEKAIFPGTEGDVTVAAIDFIRKSTNILRLRVPAGIKSGLTRIRLVTCGAKEVLLPELELIAVALGEKGPFEGEWVWASGAVWGSGGYLGSKTPDWWQVTTGDELDQWGEVPGEGTAEAGMVFSGPFLTKKRSDGTVEEGQYTVDMTKTKTDGAGAIWAIGQLITQDVTVLCGRWPWAEQHNVYTYDILEFTPDRIVLAYAPDGTGAWDNALFWVFQRKGSSSSTYPVDLNLAQGQTVTFDGIDDIADWWIDPDFLVRVDGTDNKFTFQAMDGNYRINADKTYKHFIVEVLSNGEPARLNADGTGAIWVIGDGGIGKPSNVNGINWTESKALCMAPIGNKKYRITLTAGSQINTDAINFKFFHQKGWGDEFTNDKISTSSDLILLGNGSNGADPGNLNLQPGVTLESGAAYEFVVDLSGGINSAVLTVTKK